MRKETKICLVVGAFLVLLGSVVFAAVMTAYNWNFQNLSAVEYDTNTHTVKDAFSKISINTDTADILFASAEDNTCKIVCYEQENARHSVGVEDDTLSIRLEDAREWYEYIGINFGTPKITVYLPEAQYASLLIKGSTGDIEIPKDCKFENMDISVSTGDIVNDASATELIKIHTSTGNIRTENISADALDLTVTTGKITVTNAICDSDISIHVSTGKTKITDSTCKNLVSDGNTGDISLNQVIAAEGFSIVRSTGDIKLDRCDAQTIFLETDTGDITGSLLTDKVFITQTSTGHVDIPKTTAGGRCEITTSTGDIKITIH